MPNSGEKDAARITGGSKSVVRRINRQAEPGTNGILEIFEHLSSSRGRDSSLESKNLSACFGCARNIFAFASLLVAHRTPAPSKLASSAISAVQDYDAEFQADFKNQSETIAEETSAYFQCSFSNAL